jgi:hypothetical protein
MAALAPAAARALAPHASCSRARAPNARTARAAPPPPPPRARLLLARPRARAARGAPARAALSPEATRAAVDAAVRGDASALAAATGHAVNATANIGIPDVSLFLLCVAAPPVALAVRFGSDAWVAITATSALMVLPTLSLFTRASPPWPAGAPPRARAAPLPLLCLLAAEGIALARCYIFTGGGGV